MPELSSRGLLDTVFSTIAPAELKHLVARSAQSFAQSERSGRGGDDPERSLDPLPYVLSGDDRRTIERGMAEWGDALDQSYRRLRDGRDFCCSEDLNEAIWRDAGFDPALNGLLPAQRSPLSVLRFDLVKAAGQGWRLLSVGAGPPQGLGLALETRVVHGRVFSPLLNRSKVIRLAPFFRNLKQEWYTHALHHLDEPAVMVWTPGPGDPDYAEYVYLCRYFGFPLVESRDLTVRSGKVYLKMLGGLRPVDVLVRTVGDRAIDPLCGNPPPFDGVAGLAQALRDGELFVDNAPGSDVLSHPGLLPALAALAEAALRRPLALPPAAPGWLAETEPFWQDGSWREAPYCLSLFAARFGGGWHCMPGGLARGLRPGRDGTPTPNRLVNKDVWFLSGASVPFETLLPQRGKPSPVSRSADLPSRIADDLFWLGRYAERAWVDIRFVGKWLELSADEGGDALTQRQTALMERLVAKLGMAPEGESGIDGGAWRLWGTLRELAAVASRVRDRFSMETHRAISELAALAPSKRGRQRPAREALDSASLLIAAFNGLANENMTRGNGWRFLDMGKRIERARLLAEALAAACASPPGADELSLVLELFDSLITYRNRYYFAAELGPVLDLLLLDESNPRSVAFQAAQLEDHLAKIPHGDSQTYRRDGERSALRLLTSLRLAEGPQLAADAAKAGRHGLAGFLAEAVGELDAISDAIHRNYLAKIEELRRLQASNAGEQP